MNTHTNNLFIKLSHLVWHYGTFLVAQHASKPAEYKHVDQDDDID